MIETHHLDPVQGHIKELRIDSRKASWIEVRSSIWIVVSSVKSSKFRLGILDSSKVTADAHRIRTHFGMQSIDYGNSRYLSHPAVFSAVSSRLRSFLPNTHHVRDARPKAFQSAYNFLSNVQCFSIVYIEEERPACPHPTALHHFTHLDRFRLALRSPRPSRWVPCDMSASWRRDNTLLCRPVSRNQPPLRYCKVIEHLELSSPPQMLFLFLCTERQTWLSGKPCRRPALVVRIKLETVLVKAILFSYSGIWGCGWRERSRVACPNGRKVRKLPSDLRGYSIPWRGLYRSLV